MVSKYNQEQRQKNSGFSGGQGSRSSKRRGNFGHPSSEGKFSGGKRRFMSCRTCGKSHTGACFQEKKNVCYSCGQEGHIDGNCPNARKGECYNCGVVGHIAKFCPKKRMAEGEASKGSKSSRGSAQSGRPMARTFNMTVQDAMASKDVVSSIIPVNDIRLPF